MKSLAITVSTQSESAGRLAPKKALEKVRKEVFDKIVRKACANGVSKEYAEQYVNDLHEELLESLLQGDVTLVEASKELRALSVAECERLYQKNTQAKRAGADGRPASRSFLSLSKKDNGRSLMLKAIMPKLSGDRGKELVQAFLAEDGDKVGELMHKIADELREALVNK